MDYVLALSNLASKFTLNADIAESPLDRVLTLRPPAELLDKDGLALSVIELENVLVELPVRVDLPFLGKWVRSLTSDLPADPDDPIGGMPIVDQIPGPAGLTAMLPPGTLMTSDAGQADVPGIPEVLGRVKGTIINTIERLREVVKRLPVELSVRWQVIDDATGKPPADVTWQMHPEDWQAYFPVVVGFGGMPLPLRLRLPLFFSELTTGVPQVLRVTVHASIKLKVEVEVTPPVSPTPSLPPKVSPGTVAADDTEIAVKPLDVGKKVGLETAWIALPPLPLLIPTVPVPTILVLCEHPEFGGRKLVLVPENSLIGAASGVAGATTIDQALRVTSSALETVNGSVDFVRFLGGMLPFAAGASSVLASLAASPGQTIIARHSVVPDLTAPGYAFSPGWTADNMTDSMICVGRPGTVFRLHHHPNFDKATRLELALDERLACAIRIMDWMDPMTVEGEPSPPLSDELGPRFVYGDRDANVIRAAAGNDYTGAISSLTITRPGERFVKV